MYLFYKDKNRGAIADADVDAGIPRIGETVIIRDGEFDSDVDYQGIVIDVEWELYWEEKHGGSIEQIHAATVILDSEKSR